MRVVMSALAVAAVTLSAPAQAEIRLGHHASSGQRELAKIENEYHDKFAKERRECRKKQNEAKDQSEWSKARRECREKLAEIERDFRKKLREERRKLREDARHHHDD